MISEVDKRCAKGWLERAMRCVDNDQPAIAISHLEMARKCIAGEPDPVEEFSFDSDPPAMGDPYNN